MVNSGAALINDISGGEMDAGMFPPGHQAECALHNDAHAGVHRGRCNKIPNMMMWSPISSSGSEIGLRNFMRQE
ncbi:MAG: hypothetical protein MZV63_00375 [Marinilabiliales bacterium]|nr:hypothetical protein [Marinilabiliales bacterium]